MIYLLCNACRRAWVAPVAASCCGERPIECSPWSSDARTWYLARVGGRSLEIVAFAHYRANRDHRASLLKGILARGNTSARLRGAA